MSPEAQQLALAKFCEPEQRWEIFDDVYVGAETPYKKLVGYRYPAHTGWILAKDYLNDLNAMHRAEKKLPRGLAVSFGYYLTDCLERDVPESKRGIEFVESCLWHTTAAQRAEALLRVIGKWED